MGCGSESVAPGRGRCAVSARLASLGAVGVAMLLLAGCADAGTAAGGSATPPADAVIFIAGAHANMPAAQVPVEIAPVLEAAVRDEAPITVIANDGTPAVSFQLSGYTVSTVNPEATRNDVDHVVAAVIDAITHVAADSDGNDLGAALAVARDQAVADGAVAASIVVIDSGLTDRGYPMMTTPGILDADRSAVVVEVAQQNGYLPTMPPGTTVTMIGLGYGAPPQPDLTPARKDSVKAIWRAVLEASGAVVVMIDKPRTGAGTETTFSTGIVAPGSYEDLSFQTADDGSVQATLGADVLFAFGSAELDAHAQSALEELRDFLKATPGSILITGHTDATGDATANLVLSLARADATRAWLTEHGIDASRMTTQGRGSADPVVPNASTPEQLQQNRRVTATVTP